MRSAGANARAHTMKRHSIKRRLSAIFAIFGLLLVVFGVFSIWRLAAVYDASAEIRDRWLISTRLLGDLNNSTSDYRAAEASHLIAPDPAEMGRIEKEIGDLHGAIARARKSYEELPHDATETLLWTEFSRNWEDYRKIADDVVVLSAKGRKTDGNRLYLAESRDAYTAASDALGALTDRTVGSAKDASDRAEVIFQQTRSLIVVAIALLVLMSVLVMRHISQSVLGPILDLATRMRSLAANHTDIETPGTERQDEIGEMARSIVVFRDNAIELAHSQRGLEQQALMISERLEQEQRLTDLQRNFVSMASHEFRTPLTVIDGQAQRLVKMSEQGISAKDIVERAERIRMAVRRMTNLTERLLNSLQLFEANAELYYHPTRFDLAELLHEVCQTFREISPGSQIVENLRNGSRTATGDPKLLYQAFSNLLSNAVKYSPDGGLVELSAYAEPGHEVIVVADRGIGIPAADRDRLFERYHRGSNVKGVVGTGIGLYLVKMVVEMHGGSISVESEEGKGSRFIVRLPIVRNRQV
jgi:two-component system OmpR family sensor kinase